MSLLRIVGALLLIWLGLIIATLMMFFPDYPETKSQWFWLIAAGPPALLVSWAGFEWIGAWISTWLKRKNPELRTWESILILLSCLALVAWGLHSIP